MLSHFVVVYDHTTGNFFVDEDERVEVYPNGPLYDEENDWRTESDVSNHEKITHVNACIELSTMLYKRNAEME